MAIYSQMIEQLKSMEETYNDLDDRALALSDDYDCAMAGYGDMSYYDCMDEMEDIEEEFEDFEEDYTEYFDLFRSRSCDDELEAAIADMIIAHDDCFTSIRPLHQDMFGEDYVPS